MPSDLIKLTALWRGETRNGDTFYRGRLGAARILVFENKNKTEDKHPDFEVYLAPIQRDEEQSEPTSEAPPADAGTGDDIPF